MEYRRGKRRGGSILHKAALCAGGLAVAGAVETAYFYRRVMKRAHTDVERTTKMAGTDWSQYKDFLAQRKEYMLAQEHMDVYRTSYDGLKLHSTFFPPGEMQDAKKRVVLCFHGYTSKGMQDFIGLSYYYLQRGYGMLHPDARAHGSSEGEYIGFGCLDRRDALEWINWVIENCGEEVEILLHGISMGGATVLMASGLELPPQVKGIISDCAFTSPKEVFTHVLHSMYHLPAFPVIPAADLINRRVAGYGMDECNARREVAKAKVPILFIHGSADTFVPCSMCREMYECCSSPKKLLIVEDAAHAESYYKNREAYEKALNEFQVQIFGQIG
ncbi:MAG: alpha/beta hydrolase [Lachnospiraceae bacterium]|nr:alpha/beta hydrolase [Lachnospiraceae bacterium]MCI7595105.1 alpha/beta hydrolase [Lachnospiraceae bacterium]MDD7051187.1 alpha/beta hydrolase [Lachnospiraceae bacterium]MDY3222705.1 alpha/beta hydrolase [Lachnospiraceae bacterium]MDY4097407.1 alpha/beta hydrolase [Lachnospiraceae bacterium]